MKILTKLSALAIAAIMLLSFASCSGKTGITGTWKNSIDFNKAAESMEGETTDEEEKAMYDVLFKAFEGLTLDLELEFTEDGKYKFYADKEASEATFGTLKSRLADLLPEAFEAMGMSKSDFNEYLKSSGTTKEDFAESFMEDMNFNDLTDGFDGTYRFEEGKLYMDSETDYFTVELNGDSLALKEINGNIENFEGFAESLIPMEFTRK